MHRYSVIIDLKIVFSPPFFFFGGGECVRNLYADIVITLVAAYHSVINFPYSALKSL